MDAYILILLTRSMRQCSYPLKNIKDTYFSFSFLYISMPNIFIMNSLDDNHLHCPQNQIEGVN